MSTSEKSPPDGAAFLAKKLNALPSSVSGNWASGISDKTSSAVLEEPLVSSLGAGVGLVLVFLAGEAFVGVDFVALAGDLASDFGTDFAFTGDSISTAFLTGSFVSVSTGVDAFALVVLLGVFFTSSTNSISSSSKSSKSSSKSSAFSSSESRFITSASSSDLLKYLLVLTFLGAAVGVSVFFLFDIAFLAYASVSTQTYCSQTKIRTGFSCIEPNRVLMSTMT